MFSLNNILCMLSVFSACHGVDIQKYFKVCNRNALDVNKCLVDAVQKGIAAMVNGIPDLDVQPIDPIHKDDYKMSFNSSVSRGSLLFKNIRFEGMKSAVVHDARLQADKDKFHLEVDLTTPSVSVWADYNGEGEFKTLKVAAYGTGNTTLKDLVYTWKIDGVPEKIGNETYVRIKDFYMRPTITRMYTYFTNENLETKDMCEQAVTYANENWKESFNEFIPCAQENWQKYGVETANKVFLKVPYDQLFPATNA